MPESLEHKMMIAAVILTTIPQTLLQFKRLKKRNELVKNVNDLKLRRRKIPKGRLNISEKRKKML